MLQEKEILHQVAQGSEAAFRSLFNEYRRKLFTYVFKITDSAELAEDAVHDVFLKIWLNRAQLPQVDNFNAYVHRMAHNVAYSGFRRKAKETLILAELRNGLSETDTQHPGKLLVAKEVRELINAAMEKLTPQQKLIFRMSREQGLKHEEIAKELDLSISTVKKHIGAALAFLREEVGEAYGPAATILFILYQL